MYRLNIDQQQKKPRRRFRRIFKLLLIPILFIFAFVSIFLIDYKFFSGSELLEHSSIIKAVSSSSDIIGKVIDTELKHENNVTSVLIVGIDTRNVVFENGEFKSTKPKGQAGTRNTDTIIQVIYDHEKKSMSMISVPRDLGVDLVENCVKFHGSIHWVYDKAEAANCPGRGVEELKETVTSVTGIPIQYHVFITLDSFVEAIETVGEENPSTKETGIYIDNPSDVWDVYPYNDNGWENVFFKKGRIFLSGEDALKYVRVRQLTTDFGRARRQQIVIEAVLSRVLSSETFLNPEKLSELYRIYQEKTLVSEVTIREILAGMDLIESFDLGTNINIILDPALGGDEVYLNKQPHNRPGGPYYMVPTHWKDCPGNEFCRVQQLISNILSNPKVYNEQATAYAYATKYDQGKLDFGNISFKELSENDPPLTMSRSKNLITLAPELKTYENIIIFDFSGGKYPNTKDFLESELDATVLDGANYKRYQLNKENFTIVLP